MTSSGACCDTNSGHIHINAASGNTSMKDEVLATYRDSRIVHSEEEYILLVKM